VSDPNYDVVIIGSGPGGYTAAIRAGQLGMKTALVEKEKKLGGTCLHVGCVPTKALLFSAEVYEYICRAEEFGFENLQHAKVNWAAILERQIKIIAKHAKGLEALMRKNKVEVISGCGRLTGPAMGGYHSIEISPTADVGGDNALQLKAKHVVVATGSSARMLPGVEPGPRVLTNVEILRLNEIPKSLVVVGSGAVGVEFASAYNRFGTEVTILETLPRLVPVEDEEISKELERAFRNRGISLVLNATVKKIDQRQQGVLVSFTAESKRQYVEAERVLVAVGRKPNTEDVRFEKTRAKVERGFVHVSDSMETAEPGVYAVGDIVAGYPQLAHAASMEALIAIAHIAGRPCKAAPELHIPGCTYCEPQIGSVGLSEAQARARGFQVKVGKFPFAANSKASVLGQHEGFIKVVADAVYGEILGVHIIGPSATELIAEAVTAMDMEATVEDLQFTVRAHPTLWEGMADAVNSVYGLAINV
jgi:dihydrolipoamide dehydrogenase